MYKPSPKIIALINRRIKRLRKLQRTSIILDTLINFLIILINISSIILAFFILEIEYTTLEPFEKETFGQAIINIGYSSYFAALIIILFVLSIVFAIYKTKTKYRKYKQIFKDFEYLVVKFKNVKEYTLEEFQKDLDEVETRNLRYIKVGIKKAIRDSLMKKVS